MSDDIKRSAEFSPCRTWRYTLERYWGPGPHVLFILLNPSTADETYDDPTNRRGQSFARDWRMHGVVFCNLFAFRTPDPREMKSSEDPVGPENNYTILEQAARADKIVLAWGIHGTFRERDEEVLKLLQDRNYQCYHLGLTKHSHPKHPLYLRSDTQLESWTWDPYLRELSR